MRVWGGAGGVHRKNEQQRRDDAEAGCDPDRPLTVSSFAVSTIPRP
jgi:hypothetical protein